MASTTMASTTASAEIGLEALHETRRTRAWVARHCAGAERPGLEERLLSIERHLLCAIAADSGRALHYDSLYIGRANRWDHWGSSSGTNGLGVSTLDFQESELQPYRQLKPELEPEPELKPEPCEAGETGGKDKDAHSDAERHIHAVVLGAASAAWRIRTQRTGCACSVPTRVMVPKDHQLTSRLHELESQLKALGIDHAAKQAAWESERSKGVELIQQLRMNLARMSDDHTVIAAEARADEAEAAASAQAEAGAKLRKTIKRGARRLAAAETQALQYGAEVGQLKMDLHRLEQQLKTRDEMLAFYEQKLRQKDGELAMLSSRLAAPSVATSVRRPASPPPQQAICSSTPQQQNLPQRNYPWPPPPPLQQLQLQQEVSDGVGSVQVTDTSAARLPKSPAASSRFSVHCDDVFSNNQHMLGISSALAQSERKALVLQEEVKHLRRVQQLRSKSRS